MKDNQAEMKKPVQKADLAEIKKEMNKIWIKKEVHQVKDESAPDFGAGTSSRK